MPKKTERKIEKLEDLRRHELIRIIQIYNRNNIIKNYHKQNKSQLIEAINKHIIFSNNFKEIQPKPNKIKLVEYDKFKKNEQLQKKEEQPKKKEEQPKKEEEYKSIDKKYNKLVDELEKNNIPNEPQRESISFQEGKQKYGVKSKTQLNNLLDEKYSKEIKEYINKFGEKIDRIKEIQKEKEMLYNRISEIGIPLSIYFKSKISEKIQALIRFSMDKGDKYAQSQVKNLTKEIMELENEFKKFYPDEYEKEKEQKSFLYKNNIKKNDLKTKRIINNNNNNKMPAKYEIGQVVIIKDNISTPVGVIIDKQNTDYIIAPLMLYEDTQNEVETLYTTARQFRKEELIKVKANKLTKKLPSKFRSLLSNKVGFFSNNKSWKDTYGYKINEFDPEENQKVINEILDLD